jgi:ribosomal protein S18 acetylase RimI-like enzyme
MGGEREDQIETRWRGRCRTSNRATIRGGFSLSGLRCRHLDMKDPALRYRPLAAEHIASISAVHRRVCLIAYTFMNWSYSEAEVREWYAGKFPDWDWGLVVEDATRLVGFIATTGTHIDQLFVDPDYQNRGIGTSLLTNALRRTPAATLNVFELNASARRFYEKYGFREVGRFFNASEQAIELVYRRDHANVPGANPDS